MREELLSVGIDLGTSTTQLIFSKLIVENMASSYTVPRMVITKKQIQYKSDIHFTPLLDQNRIDTDQIKAIVEQEYAKAGVKKEQIDTGAVIITGETARKENAREVLNTLSGFAGDFVVATAGPDLESVISGKGAGADLYSKEHNTCVVNMDIGGGTSNLSVFKRGETVDTGCLDIGGRLIKVDKDTGQIAYIAPKLLTIIEEEGLALAVGKSCKEEELRPILDIMVSALEASVGLTPKSKYDTLLITNKGIQEREDIEYISFSGGVADGVYHPERFTERFPFGDIGILLGEAIRKSRLFRERKVIEGDETIRATVVGAGSHTTEISGSTVTYTMDAFPMKNLPVCKLSHEEEGSEEELSAAITRKLKWFMVEGEIQRVVVALNGEENPSFKRVQEYARALLQGMEPLMDMDTPLLVIVEKDMGKALGQTMYHMCDWKKDVVCLDGIHLGDGDYIDIGKPIAEGCVLPVVVKTLVFHS